MQQKVAKIFYYAHATSHPTCTARYKYRNEIATECFDVDKFILFLEKHGNLLEKLQNICHIFSCCLPISEVNLHHILCTRSEKHRKLRKTFIVKQLKCEIVVYI